MDQLIVSDDFSLYSLQLMKIVTSAVPIKAQWFSAGHKAAPYRPMHYVTLKPNQSRRGNLVA